MSDQFDTDQAPETGGGEPAYDAIPEPSVDLGDAISQLNSAAERQYEPEFDGAPYDDEGAELDPRAVIEGLIDERVAEQVGPVLDGLEMDRRAQEVLQLAEQFPQLREPQMIEGISADLADLADRYQDPSIETDPTMIRLALFARIAEGATAGPEPRQAGGQRGQHVETGSGPGAPRPQADPVADAYTKALVPGARDPYGFPT